MMSRQLFIEIPRINPRFRQRVYRRGLRRLDLRPDENSDNGGLACAHTYRQYPCDDTHDETVSRSEAESRKGARTFSPQVKDVFLEQEVETSFCGMFAARKDAWNFHFLEMPRRESGNRTGNRRCWLSRWIRRNGSGGGFVPGVT